MAAVGSRLRHVVVAGGRCAHSYIRYSDRMTVKCVAPSLSRNISTTHRGLWQREGSEDVTLIDAAAKIDLSHVRSPVLSQQVAQVFKQLPGEVKSRLFMPPRVSWVESMSTVDGERLGLAELHPAAFAHFPRIDLLHQNVRWQQEWRRVTFKRARTREEMPGGGRKPWRQKGTGRARQGSCRAPQWLMGGKSHGPRGPKTYYYLLPLRTRVRGLCVALSVKFAQDSVFVVDSLDIPSVRDGNYLDAVADARKWGVSVLYVDVDDVTNENMALACRESPGMTVMPLYGLNVYSILKYDTLVLTLPALELLESRILKAYGKMFVNYKWYENPLHGESQRRVV